ncbi:hypothetical protein MtrunA17_Chr6g0466071 [Medicago truncatula]|uniref:Uncharacterized protein n=1 Tax=Medicago truncatula TaxID=3880 RepID=A0A396HD53_MEDTR|nr:hypothetical protein MtrunA17_Chr6g0466071 [Medicago truncatula]
MYVCSLSVCILYYQIQGNEVCLLFRIMLLELLPRVCDRIRKWCQK